MTSLRERDADGFVAEVHEPTQGLCPGPVPFYGGEVDGVSLVNALNG